MSTANPHRIGRQVLELELAGAAGAAELQEQAASRLRQGSAELATLFDRAAGPGELVRIERLEIDLGELRGLGWRDQLHERLLDRLGRSLGRRDRRRRGRAEAETARRAPDDVPFEQLLFFLANGRLPWWGPRPAASWLETPPEPRDRTQRQALAALLQADGRALRRLVLTVPEDYLAARVAELARLVDSQAVIPKLIPASLDGARRRQWRWRFWHELLGLATGERQGDEAGAALLRRLLAPLDGKQPTAEQPPRAALEETRAGHVRGALAPSLPEPWRSWLERALAGPPAAAAAPGTPAAGLESPEQRAGPEPSGLPTGLGPPGLPAAESQEAGAGAEASVSGLDGSRPRDAAARGSAPDPLGVPSQSRAVPPPEPETRPELPLAVTRPATEPPPVAETEAIYVDGAGIVILHPFIEELFSARDLLVERRFRDPEARARAVHLLGHLAFGADRPEHELLLPKLLCAMSWEDPLEPVELDADDRAACAELLTAVLGHWRALKSASVDWLREQFFLRDGKLERVDDGWRLTVESHAQDVLFSRLPWGLGLIRLPWAEELLYVSWTE